MKKNILRFMGVIAIMGTLATSAFAVPYDGSSVTINSMQYTFSTSTNNFTTAIDGSTPSQTVASTPGKNTGSIDFLDPLGNPVWSGSGTLEVTPVDFSAGLSSGTGGGFIVKDASSNTLLSGSFGSGSSITTNAITGAEFESSVIISFIEPNIVGTNYYIPGLFSATLGDIGALTVHSWTSTRSATASIQSSVPEPTTLILLGFGLLGFAIVRRKTLKA